MVKLVVRGVLAGAHKTSLKSLLTHAVEIDDAGTETRVMCKSVKFESVMEGEDENLPDPPTCKTCLRAWLKANAAK